MSAAFAGDDASHKIHLGWGSVSGQMDTDDDRRLTRRQLLGGGAAVTAGAFAYGTDNPVHRSSVAETAARSADEPPEPGASWTAVHSPDLPGADVTQLVGVRYIGDDVGSAKEVGVDVLAVAVGRRSTPFGSGGLLDTHRLGVRGTGASGTRGIDSGHGWKLASGPVRPPDSVADATGLDPAALDDPDAVRERVLPDGEPKADRDLALARPLLAAAEGSPSADRLTLAGVVHAVQTDDTRARKGTRKYEGGGEAYRWPLDGVVAHAVRYRQLYVYVNDGRAGLKVASAVPRPSLLGSPRIEGALSVSFPA